MRIPSGKTDQYIYFVAVDATDLKTRETGLGSFTVYRSRNGGAATAYTTPTISELSAVNMPGVYAFLIDEDTTIGASSDSEEYVVHITQASMAPVTRSIELYRRDTTSGRTLDVSAGGEAGIDWANIGSPTTSVNLSATNIDVDQVIASVSGAVGSVTGAVGSVTGAVGSVTGNVGGNVVGSVGSVTGAVGSVTGAVGSVTGNVGGNVVGSVGSVTGLTAANLDVAVSTRLATAGYTVPPTAAANADAVWDEVLADHLTAGSTGNALNAAGSAGDPWSTALPGAYGAGTAGKIIGDNINAPIATVDTVVDAIKAKTDSLTFTKAGEVDANIQSVNDVTVTGNGQAGSEWGP